MLLRLSETLIKIFQLRCLEFGANAFRGAHDLVLTASALIWLISQILTQKPAHPPASIAQNYNQQINYNFLKLGMEF